MWLHHSLTYSLHSCLSAWRYSPPPFAGSAGDRATIGQARAPAARQSPLLPSIAIHLPPAVALKGVSSASGCRARLFVPLPDAAPHSSRPRQAAPAVASRLPGPAS